MPSGSFSKDSSPLRLTKMLQRQSSNPDTLSRTFWEPNFPEHIASGNTRSDNLKKKPIYPSGQAWSTAPPHCSRFTGWPSPALGGVGLEVRLPRPGHKELPKKCCLSQSQQAGTDSMARGKGGRWLSPKTYSPRRFLLEDPNPLQPWQEVQPHVPPQRQVLQPQSWLVMV